jgi:signal transduction histidine kinase
MSGSSDSVAAPADVSAVGVRMLLELTHAASGIAHSDTVRTTLDDVAAQIMSSAEADACSVLLYDATTAKARHVGISGHDETYVDDLLAVMEGDAAVTSDASYNRHELVVHDDLGADALDPLWAPLVPHLLSAGWTTLISAPVMDRTTCVGVITVFFTDRERADPEACAFIAALADFVAVAVRNARLIESVRAVTAIEQRQALARDIHDVISQNLFAVVMHARAAQTRLSDPFTLQVRDQVLTSLASIEQMSSVVQEEMRRLITALRPNVAAGLAERLWAHAEELRSVTVVDLRIIDELPGKPVTIGRPRASGHDAVGLLDGPSRNSRPIDQARDEPARGSRRATR